MLSLVLWKTSQNLTKCSIIFGPEILITLSLQTGRQAGTHTGMQAGRQTARQTDRQMDRQTDEQKEQQTDGTKINTSTKIGFYGEGKYILDKKS